MDDDAQERQLNIHLDPEHLAGVYANFANISFSDYEFTLTFARIDHSTNGCFLAAFCFESDAPPPELKIIDSNETDSLLSIATHGQTYRMRIDLAGGTVSVSRVGFQ